jgi:hypothetical protein
MQEVPLLTSTAVASRCFFTIRSGAKAQQIFSPRSRGSPDVIINLDRRHDETSAVLLSRHCCLVRNLAAFESHEEITTGSGSLPDSLRYNIRLALVGVPSRDFKYSRPKEARQK